MMGIALVCMESLNVRAVSAYPTVQSGNLSEIYPKEISIRQAASKKVNGAFVLDVRELHEFVQDHIPGAMMIPFRQLRNRLYELPQDKEIVVVCLSGGRSLAALDILREAGYNKSSSMAGGMNAWKAAGFPTVTGR